jgi:hypothetical protein
MTGWYPCGGAVTVRLHGRAIALTSIELAVLRELMKARDRPLSRTELLDAAWGEGDLEVSACRRQRDPAPAPQVAATGDDRDRPQRRIQDRRAPRFRRFVALVSLGEGTMRRVRHMKNLCLASILCIPALAAAQPAEPAPPAPAPAPPVTAPPATPEEPPKDAAKDHKEHDKPWYEKLTIRGYLQVRFNRLYATEDDFRNDLGDKNIAENNRFSLRRARLVVAGDVAPFLAIYTQAELAGADAKMRDWYGDIFLDPKKEFRLRVGQSKVPYGFENIQSSQNRAPLDRSDPINSGVPGERDLGVFAYWAPAKVRELFKHLVDSGLKGSGDYGVVALGTYNGQGINVDDKNENLHVVGRVTYPFETGGQIIEAGVQGYVGKFTVEKDPAAMLMGGDEVDDMRAAASVILYPQPIGFQAEWNVGKGPELVGDTITDEKIDGGYAMVNARIKLPYGELFPYVRGAFYEGGIKSVKNAPHHESKELVVGTEWSYNKRIELTFEMDHAKRTIADDTVWGTIFRLQAQLNY